MERGLAAPIALREIKVAGYERVVEVDDEASGLHALVAIHDTTMGPALGGVRIYPYSSRDEALEDVLRLSRGMTYKSAIAESGFGGGKSVIIADPAHDKTNDLLKRYADLLNSLDGLYICGKDLGSSLEDLLYIRQYTRYVGGFSGEGSSGDPSPFTAWGIVRGMEASAHWIWGSDDLEGRTIAVQGLGGVGMRLVDSLFWKGAKLVVADVDKERTQYAKRMYHTDVASVEEIVSVRSDIFAPCARGGVLSELAIDHLRCRAVVGCANNQLANEKCGQQLQECGILYAPDFVVNSGGLLNVAAEFEPEGYDPAVPRTKVYRIYGTLLSIYQVAAHEGRSTAEVALNLAQQKLAAREGARCNPIRYH